MAANRIKVAKNKADLVQALISLDGTTGSFQTYADVVVFAAVLGAKHKRRVPLGEISKREPAPIGQEHFMIRGYDMVINLLAITENKNIKIISFNNEEYENERIHIFEEYANGGLEILKEELRGSIDYSERLLLMLNFERSKREQQEEFDLTRFLS